MRRSLNATLSLVSLASLLLFVVTIFTWWRGYRLYNSCSWNSDRVSWSAGISEGRIAFEWEWINPTRGTFLTGIALHKGSIKDVDCELSSISSRQWSCPGFVKYSSGDVDSPFVRKAFTVPCWLIALLTFAFPAWWLSRVKKIWKRHRRRIQGLCLKCGYDLRESKGTCPECGDRLATPKKRLLV